MRFAMKPPMKAAMRPTAMVVMRTGSWDVSIGRPSFQGVGRRPAQTGLGIGT
jgi:hypothetical protein